MQLSYMLYYLLSPLRNQASFTHELLNYAEHENLEKIKQCWSGNLKQRSAVQIYEKNKSMG